MAKTKPPKLVIDRKCTLLTAARNSVGSKQHQSLFVMQEGSSTDILKRGSLSCAYFICSLLYPLGLIKAMHGTVNGTVKDMEEHGWKKTRTPSPGTIIVWEATEETEGHKHIGLLITADKAVSNSTRERTPKTHHWTYGTENGKPKRKILLLLKHPALR